MPLSRVPKHGSSRDPREILFTAPHWFTSTKGEVESSLLADLDRFDDL